MKYKVIERGKPGIPGGGKKKYYAKIIAEPEVSTEDLVSVMSRNSAVTPLVCMQVLISLQYTLPELLSQGRSVHLDNIGTLYPTINSKGVNDIKQVGSENIKNFSVRFRPPTFLTKEMTEKITGIERE